MDLKLVGRVAVVNAASRGLGRGIAEALAAEGASLVISSRTNEAVGAPRPRSRLRMVLKSCPSPPTFRAPSRPLIWSMPL